MLKRPHCQPRRPGITPYRQLCGGAGTKMVLTLQGGSDGSSLERHTGRVHPGADDGPGRRTGLRRSERTAWYPCWRSPQRDRAEVQAALISFCENRKSCFAILDLPMDLKKTNDVATFRDMYDSTYAAMYHPWFLMF